MLEPPRIRTLMGMYYRHVREDLDGLRPVLPDVPAGRPIRILDIGAGLGGIDVLLDRHYEGRTELHLLDKHGLSDIFYGYRKQAAFYNRIDLTRTFMEDNGVPASRVHCHNIDTDGFPTGAFDLVISLLSWCFHYPAATYAENVAVALAGGGVLIVDVRHDTDGAALLTDALGVPPRRLLTHGTYDRLAFIRRP
ncbi:MAG: hypothetical protein GX591_15185 [Planctomycetes bacterium]|nr:hypothetical protein [Planctomycetota bacterium]